MAANRGGARVVVAVDFGTTFSGFAYAKTSEPDDVFKVYEWPGAGRASAKPYCKTPTSLFYAPSSEATSDSPLQLVDWGWCSLISYTEAARAFAKPGATSSSSSSSSSSREIPGPPDRLQAKFLPDYLLNFNFSGLGSPGRSRRHSHADVLVLPPEIAQKVGFFAQNFKLRLAPDADQNSFLPTLPAGLTVDQMVVDYLRCLTSFIMSELQVNYGKHFSIKDVQWCLTVPAIWDERSKQLMKSCAEKAGMVQGTSSPGSTGGSPFPLDIILEPEAASIYCQYKSKGLNFKKGEKLLVADVGGGTIDLVVHEKADADPESMRVHEVVGSYGDLGGGTFVDDGFFKFISRKIGCFKEFSRTNKSVVLTLYQWWQGVKAGFDGEGYSAELALPKKLRNAWEKYERSRQIQRDDEDYYDELRLEGSEIKAIFDTEVEKVISLIGEQVEGIRVLMVVGGFSASPYLRDRIKRTFEGKVEEIIIPENPGSAICHGAVQLHLKKDTIQSRIAKRTYGILYDRVVKDGDPADLQYMDDEGTWFCRDCVDVFVSTGERVPLDASITRRYSPSIRRQSELLIELVSSTSKRPQYVREEGVVQEGKFFVDLTQDMHLDKDRRVEVTMVFGASLIEVSAERTNFGQAGKEKRLSVAFLRQ